MHVTIQNLSQANQILTEERDTYARALQRERDASNQMLDEQRARIAELEEELRQKHDGTAKPEVDSERECVGINGLERLVLERPNMSKRSEQGLEHARNKQLEEELAALKIENENLKDNHFIVSEQNTTIKAVTMLLRESSARSAKKDARNAQEQHLSSRSELASADSRTSDEDPDEREGYLG